MDLVSELNNYCIKCLPTKSLGELEFEKEYKTSDFKIVSTKYDDQIVVCLDNSFNVFIPERYKSFITENLEKLNSSNISLIYKGKIGRMHNIEFK